MYKEPEAGLVSDAAIIWVLLYHSLSIMMQYKAQLLEQMASVPNYGHVFNLVGNACFLTTSK